MSAQEASAWLQVVWQPAPASVGNFATEEDYFQGLADHVLPGGRTVRGRPYCERFTTCWESEMDRQVHGPDVHLDHLLDRFEPVAARLTFAADTGARVRLVVVVHGSQAAVTFPRRAVQFAHAAQAELVADAYLGAE